MLGQFKGNLKGPAQVTAKCELITDELNLLRTLNGSRLADADTLTRIEALERYIKKIELGYRMGGYRISVRFVQVAMLNLFTALSILLPMLLVLLDRSWGRGLVSVRVRLCGVVILRINDGCGPRPIHSFTDDLLALGIARCPFIA